MTRFLDTLDSIKLGWVATSGGGAISIAANVIPDAVAVEVCLKNVVLAFTAISLLLTIALQIRSIRKGRKE